jgi:hypothetical protein
VCEDVRLRPQDYSGPELPGHPIRKLFLICPVNGDGPLEARGARDDITQVRPVCWYLPLGVDAGTTLTIRRARVGRKGALGMVRARTTPHEVLSLCPLDFASTK